MAIAQMASLIKEGKQVLSKRGGTKFDLVYYVWKDALIGSIGGESIRVHAQSGGGRGGAHPENTFASYSPYRKTIAGKQRGGVIPPGLWFVRQPSLYTGEMKGPPISELIPIGDQIADFGEREYCAAPFLIHGPSRDKEKGKGSDGCIIVGAKQRHRLLKAVERAGGAILLVSVIVEEGDNFSKNLKLARTA